MRTVPDTAQWMKRVAWRDLTGMSVREGLIECLHPLPWLAASWIVCAALHPLAALPFSFLFFLTALRLNHEAIHHNLGFSARGHRVVLHGLSALMLGSNNAVAMNHLHHHRHVMTPDDVEGKCGRMRGWQVLLYGPVFPLEMHLNAWARGGPAVRRRMRVDLVLNLAMLALWLASGWTVLGYHLAVVTVAQCLTGFFAVWITHRACEGTPHIARTQRAPLINLLSYNMFLHLEHHLFPGVPVKRLGILALRLDAAAPHIGETAGRVIDLPRLPRLQEV